MKRLIKFFKKARRDFFKPYIRILLLKLILFYQRHFSRHTCLYTPTCSEYTKRAINDYGVIIGIILGSWRILRCNPLSKGGFDPVPLRRSKLKWVI